ncbi:small, acid-soluble spore protein, alpha/beta type [Sulfobacillus thermosulfidooxidans]|uniref:small, acid-soluble spore protein, alpha/beta type n=1 Tax=Sulfobacillus thermosulfidooxidans TaxID=28034 RepID=UPI0003074785|nr:small, acid-soluble spore protein, alpha/beta type [Sulfobacillus thermosulfidooxidans]
MAKQSRNSHGPGKLKTDSNSQRLNDALKWEAAQQLGLVSKVQDVGWGGLSAKETGAIGAWVIRLKREKGLIKHPSTRSKDE